MQFYQTRVIQLAEFIKPDVDEFDLQRIQRINSSMRLGKNWFEEEKRPFQDCAKLDEKVRTLFDSSDEENDQQGTGDGVQQWAEGRRFGPVESFKDEKPISLTQFINQKLHLSPPAAPSCRVFPRLPSPPGSAAPAAATTAPAAPSGSAAAAAAAATATAPAAAPSSWSRSAPPSAATNSSHPGWRGRGEEEWCGSCMQRMERQHLLKHLSSCLTRNLRRESVIRYAFKKKTILEGKSRRVVEVNSRKQNMETAMVIIKKEVLDEVNAVEEKEGGAFIFR